MSRLSIIVPVYKAQAYLDQCMQSIADQTFADFEVILIDDGSPDRCPALCDEWAQRDSRVKVIHQENRGISAAILRGIRNCTADVVGFVDSDDWVQPDFFETLYQNLIKYDADCVNSKWTLCKGDLAADYESTYHVISYDRAAIEEKLLTPFWEEHGNLYLHWNNFRWNKLYKRGLLLKASAEMAGDLSIGEDLELNLYYLSLCQRVVDLKEYGGYMHRRNEGSITRMFKNKLVDENIAFLNSLKIIAQKQARPFAFGQKLSDNIYLDLLWQSLESNNALNDKVFACSRLAALVSSPSRLLQNFSTLHPAVLVGIKWIADGHIRAGVYYVTGCLKLIRILRR